MEDNEFYMICGEGALYGYRSVCTDCEPCEHDWEAFKGDGYTTDVYICRKCGERRAV